MPLHPPAAFLTLFHPLQVLKKNQEGNTSVNKLFS